MGSMRSTKPQTVALTRHPSSPSEAVRGISAGARIGGAGKLAVTFNLDADMTQVVLPPTQAPARADELWRHTCFEVFVALPGAEAYCELNFSPSGAWAMYGFTGYRRGMTALDVQRPPRVAVRPTGRGLVLEAITYVGELPMPQPGSPLRAGAAAVIEEKDGRLSYWALAHPAALPDFHHRLGFVLQVGVPALGEADLLADAVRNANA
jgi:hypothetical protein